MYSERFAVRNVSSFNLEIILNAEKLLIVPLKDVDLKQSANVQLS